MIAKAWNPGLQTHIHSTEYVNITDIEHFPLSIAHIKNIYISCIMIKMVSILQMLILWNTWIAPSPMMTPWTKKLMLGINKASEAMRKLHKRVPKKYSTCPKPLLKLKVYKAMVLFSLLYSCKLWTLYNRYISKLGTGHMQALWITLQDCITNRYILDHAN